jgi:hypothetical protein
MSATAKKSKQDPGASSSTEGKPMPSLKVKRHKKTSRGK